jgi:hypothetical protein
MKNKTANVVGLSAAAFFALSALNASAMEVKPLLKGGYDFGGDTLVEVVFTNGDREEIKSNEGFFIGGGVSIVNDDKTIEGELSVSYKADYIEASNGDVTWSRWPVDALVFYRFQQVRLGGGLTYHLNPELDGDGIAGGLNVDFKDALGFVVQGDWRITDKMNLGLRYTNVDYKPNNGDKVTSEGVGLVFSVSF